MKRQFAVICMVILVFTACAISTEDKVELPGAVGKGREETGSGESGTWESEQERGQPSGQGMGRDTEMEEAHLEDDTEDFRTGVRFPEENTRLRELYEIFVNREYAGLEDNFFVICDGNGDGWIELYMKRGSQKGFHVITGANGGLLIEYGKEIPDEVNGLQWTDTGTLTAGTTNGEMVHAGIYVHVEQDDDSERFWYPDEEAFLAANGFEGGEPFFEYDMPEEPGRLVFYYDEATQAGCGIRYYERDPDTFTTTGMYGFVFKGLREDGENGIPADYLEPLACDGTGASAYGEDIREHTEYDDRGRIIHYDASGLSFRADYDSRSEPFLWIDYEYYDNGSLKKRSYMHSGYVYGSAYTTWNSYFDERGRIVYEDIYITHGSLDKYYIYMDDTEEPSYILDVDNCAGEWIPEFWKAK